ncbi:15694_t:CDS:2 [Gigaspora margarita]|uniref:15694_t:CDS:1 n=1 Tax=Gigaspora margarita TaxID=4874 RepID=A0ABN7VCI5_GIGMA|nr:15694_t:CDS:2 [Gigaspora margarita]
MSSNFHADIAEDYKQLYETREDYDVIIYAGEEPNAEEIHAHSLVLRTRSTYFRGALSSGWTAKDKDSGCFIFNKPNISPLIFEFILKYLYCGEINIQNQDRETILELLVASDEFGLTKLIDHVQQLFGENLEIHLSQNPVDILYIVAQHETFNKIRKLSLEAIRLKDDVTEFNKDDFELLAKTLQKCIQYIRFHEISMQDFYRKVLPYMPILPSNLFNDILRCYMFPNSVPLYNAFPHRKIFDSILIKIPHVLLFASWIDKKNNDHYKDMSPYKFILLFRGSIDGFKNSIFHQRCDEKGATLVVAKIQNSNQLIGGYSPIDWDTSNQNKSSTDSFVFSLSDSTNFSNVKLGRISSSHYSHAIYCYSSHGPNFGNGDLHLNGSCVSTSGNGYHPSIGISNGSQIEDYEVFQVIKK